MHILFSEMVRASSSSHLELAKVAWVGANMMAREYGFTIIELFTSLVYSEMQFKPQYSLEEYIKNRQEIPEDDRWQFDMQIAEEVIDSFATFIPRKRQIELLHSLMPSESHCNEIIQMLKSE